MKKSTRIILVIAICLLCAGLVLTAVGYVCGASLRQIIHDDLWSWVVHDDDGIHLFSDRHKDDHHGSGKYDNEFDESNTYSIDADGVNKLSIDWIDGDIQVVAYDGDSIRLEESCKEEIDEDNSLRYKIKNGELYITCCREASYEIGILSNSLNGKNLNKPLVVKIPKTLADKLKELQIDAVSSNITADGLTIKEFYASTVSGDVSLSGSYADEVEVDTVSGDMDLALLQCPKDFAWTPPAAISPCGCLPAAASCWNLKPCPASRRSKALTPTACLTTTAFTNTRWEAADMSWTRTPSAATSPLSNQTAATSIGRAPQTAITIDSGDVPQLVFHQLRGISFALLSNAPYSSWSSRSSTMSSISSSNSSMRSSISSPLQSYATPFALLK